jgi:hypothetical protein
LCHFCYTHPLSLKVNAPPTTKRVIYDYKRANWTELKNILTTRLPVEIVGDINAFWEELKNTFWQCVNSCIPKRTVKGKSGHPWVTRKVVQIIHKRDKLFKKWRSDPFSTSVLLAYLSAKRLARKNISSSFESYMWNLGRGREGQQIMWKHIHSKSKNKTLDKLVVGGDAFNSPQDMANNFASTFDLNYNNDKGTTDNIIPRNAKNIYKKHDYAVVTQQHVKSMLKSFWVSIAARPDGIPPRILQNCAEVLSFSLCA